MSKKLKKMFCILFAVLFLISLIGTFKTTALIPTNLYLFSLELLAIGYYNNNNKKRYNLMCCLYGVGISIIIFATFYTIIKII